MDPADYGRLSPLLAHPVCLELAHHALGESVQMVEATALLRKPGAPAHPLHCTAPAAWFAEQGFPIPRYRIVLPFSWILTDLTHESGSRLFMPLSQLSGRLPDPDHPYKHVTRIEAPAGSLVLFNGATWHGLAANDSVSHQRVELASGYMPGWYDVRTPGYRLLKPSVWERMPPEGTGAQPASGRGVAPARVIGPAAAPDPATRSLHAACAATNDSLSSIPRPGLAGTSMIPARTRSGGSVISARQGT